MEYQAGGGGERLVDLVNQLNLERCHNFLDFGSCRKSIPIRDSSMQFFFLSQCGVSSKMFIGLIVPTTCSSVYQQSLIGISTSSFKILNMLTSLEFSRLIFKSVQPRF